MYHTAAGDKAEKRPLAGPRETRGIENSWRQEEDHKKKRAVRKQPWFSQTPPDKDVLFVIMLCTTTSVTGTPAPP